MYTLTAHVSAETSYTITKFCKVYRECNEYKITKPEAANHAVLNGLAWIKNQISEMEAKIDQRNIEKKTKLIKDLQNEQ